MTGASPNPTKPAGERRPSKADRSPRRQSPLLPRGLYALGAQLGDHPGIAATLLGLTLAMVALSFQRIWSPDLGTHLATGHWILEHFRVPEFDVFTYTVSHQKDTDLWWLYQILVALIDRLGGSAALLVMNTVLLAVSGALVLLRLSLRSPGSLQALPMLMLVGLLAWLFEIRPHVVSWIYLNLLLLVLEAYDRDRSTGLFALPLLMAFWMNTHPLAAVGWGVVGCYVVGSALRDRSLDLKLLAYAGACVVAGLLTPYGVEGLLVPIRQFLFFQSGSVFKSTIAEFLSPFTLAEYAAGGRPFFLQSLFPFHLYALLAAGGLMLGMRRERMPDLLLWGLFFFLFASAQRNFSLFFFVTLPFLAEGYGRLGRRAGTNAESRGLALRARLLDGTGMAIRRSWVVVLPAALVLALGARTDAYYVATEAPVRSGWEFDDHRLPVQAARFIARSAPDARILNPHDIGGYLIYAVPQPVFIDGRHYVLGEEFYLRYRRSFQPGGLEDIIREYRPDLAVFPYRTTLEWLFFFRSRAEWRVAFIDDHSVVFLRRGYRPEIPALEEHAALPSDELGAQATDRILQDPRPRGVEAFLRGLLENQYYPRAEIGRSFLCSVMGWEQAAMRWGVEGLRRSTVESPTLLFNLGALYAQAGEYRRAAICYERSLQARWDSETAERLSALRGLLP